MSYDGDGGKDGGEDYANGKDKYESKDDYYDGVNDNDENDYGNPTVSMKHSLMCLL